ncbi:hypothetical protein LCGC14_0343260 [marine sediment metagenome]|uniref:Uncharacterized protein n=1 Tax=marine sediment metagenome TaxID=412755 RepID=A0A0F9WKV6_9ZZZZ
MAEPTSALSYQSLLLRVAELYGIASYDSNGLPYIPVDNAFNFHECKRLVTEAIRMFIARPPSTGKWRWMHRTHTQLLNVPGTGPDNISSDAARYSLPADFGGSIAGNITYISDSQHGISIEWRDINFIHQHRELSITTGYPQWAAIRPYLPAGTALGASRRWELIFYPTPGHAKTVQFPYIMHFDNVTAEGGTASAANSTTLTDISLNIFADDHFNGYTATIISGTGKGSSAVVTDFVQSTGVVTVADWLFPGGAAGGVDPAASSIYLLEPAGNVQPCGFQFDDAIEAACLARCEMAADDSELGSKWITYFTSEALPVAWKLDGNAAPRMMGKMTDGRQFQHARVRENVAHDNAI